MGKVIAVKLLRLIPIVFLVSLAAFFLLELVPGDPVSAVLGESATPEQYELVRAELGLDRPAPERYAEWLGNAVRGDFGSSIVPPVQDVTEMIKSRLPVTIEIALVAMAMSLLIAIPLGMWSAYRAGAPFDTATSGAAFAAISIPSFLSALLLIFLVIFNQGILKGMVAVIAFLLVAGILYRTWRTTKRDGWGRGSNIPLIGAVVVVVIALALVVAMPTFPRQGFVRIGEGGIFSNLRSVFLPALTLALIEGAVFMRVLRNDMISTLQEDFILSARAKGMSTSHILVRDALRPSSFSLVTVAGVTFGRLLGGTVIVETIFRLPGMGSMLVESIQVKDYPVVQATVLVLAILYVLINTAVDLSYAYLDPRIRRGRT